MTDSDPTPHRHELRQRALSRWDDEGGALAAVAQEAHKHVPDMTNAELVLLRVRVIALENLLIAVLAEGSDRQRQAALDMADAISPRAGSTPASSHDPGGPAYVRSRGACRPRPRRADVRAIQADGSPTDAASVSAHSRCAERVHEPAAGHRHPGNFPNVGIVDISGSADQSSSPRSALAPRLAPARPPAPSRGASAA